MIGAWRGDELPGGLASPLNRIFLHTIYAAPQLFANVE
jgi:hypothetical protein